MGVCGRDRGARHRGVLAGPGLGYARRRRSTDSVADVTNISERLLRSEVEEYLERSQRVLVEPGELR